MTPLRNLFASIAVRLYNDEEGQTMAEYGILVAVIALIVLAGATLLGGNLAKEFSKIAGDLGV